MKRLVLIVVTALIAAECGESAFAQIPKYAAGPQTGAGGPTLKRSTRPVVSAYASLLGSGVGANSGIGFQYFTRVQPQVNTQRALGSLGRSVNRLQAQQYGGAGGAGLTAQQQQLMAQQGASVGLGTTGHPTGYFSHSQYFGTNLSGGSSRGGSSGGGGVGGSAPTFGGSGPLTGVSGHR